MGGYIQGAAAQQDSKDATRPGGCPPARRSSSDRVDAQRFDLGCNLSQHTPGAACQQWGLPLAGCKGLMFCSKAKREKRNARNWLGLTDFKLRPFNGTGHADSLCSSRRSSSCVVANKQESASRRCIIQSWSCMLCKVPRWSHACTAV